MLQAIDNSPYLLLSIVTIVLVLAGGWGLRRLLQARRADRPTPWYATVLASGLLVTMGLWLGAFVVRVDWSVVLSPLELVPTDDDRISAIVTLLGTCAMALAGAAASWIALGAHLRWFVRAGLVGLAIVPLLQSRAFDLLAMLALQIAVATVMLAILWQSRPVSQRGTTGLSSGGERWQVSLVDLFGLVAAVAILMAMLAPAVRGEGMALAHIAAIGACGGLAVLVAHLYVTSSLPGWFRLPLFLAAAACIGLPIQFWADYAPAGYETVWGSQGYFDIFWPAVYLLATLLVAVWMGAARSAGVLLPTKEPAASPRRFAGVRFAVATLVLLLPAARTYVAIVRPTTMPAAVLPEPNGYELLLPVLEQLEDASAGRLLPDDQMREFFVTYADQHAAVLSEAREAFRHAAWKPLPVLREVHFVERFGKYRTLACALSGAGRGAEQQRQWSEAAERHFDCIDLAETVGRGGLLLDQLVAAAIEEMGLEALHRVGRRLSPVECRQLIGRLHQRDRLQEPMEHVGRRDRGYCEDADGGEARLFYLAEDLLAIDSQRVIFSSIRLRNDAIRRLMMTELALRAYRGEQGEWPASLDALVPDYLPDVPLDPFSDQPLVYRHLQDDFLLYSTNTFRTDTGAIVRSTSGYSNLNLREYYGEASQVPQDGAEKIEEAATPRE